MIEGSGYTLVEQGAQRQGAWAGGTTRAVFADPPEALGAIASARVWVGTATIERDSNYSYLPGLTRIHLPIIGRGIHLRFAAPAELVTLPSLSQCRFDGGRPLHAELVDGPIVALNVLMQAGYDAWVDVIPPSQARVAPRWPSSDAGAALQVRVVYTCGAALLQLDPRAPAVALRAGDALLISGPADLVVRDRPDPQAPLIVVDVRGP